MEEERSVVRASASRPFLKCVVVHGAVQTNDSLARFIYHVIVPSGEAWRCVGVFERFWDHRGFRDSTLKIGGTGGTATGLACVGSRCWPRCWERRCWHQAHRARRALSTFGAFLAAGAGGGRRRASGHRRACWPALRSLPRATTRWEFGFDLRRRRILAREIPPSTSLAGRPRPRGLAPFNRTNISSFLFAVAHRRHPRSRQVRIYSNEGPRETTQRPPQRTANGLLTNDFLNLPRKRPSPPSPPRARSAPHAKAIHLRRETAGQRPPGA